MPRVPTYDTQPLQPTIRQGEARPVLSVEQATLPGRQTQEAGETLGRAGTALGQYVLRQQEIFNRAQTNAVMNEIQAAGNERLAQYQNLRGAQALENEAWNGQDGATYQNEQMQRFISERLDRVRNPAVRAAVEEQVSVFYNRFSDVTLRHFLAQGREFAVQTAEATINTTAGAFQLAPEGPDAELNLTNLRQAASDLAEQEGLAGEAATARVQEIESGALARVLTGLIEGDRFEEAERLLERRGDRFTPEARVEAQNVLNRAGAIYYGGQIADQVMLQRPAGRNDTGARERDRLAREAATVDGVFQEDRYRRAVQEIERRVSLTQRDIAASDAQSWDRFLRLHMEDPVMALTYASTLPAELHSRAVTYNNNGGQTTLTQQRAFRQVTSQPGFDVTTMSQLEFEGLRPVIGEDNFATLAQQRQAYQQNQQRFETAMGNATIDDTTITYAMDQLGIQTNQRASFIISARRAVATHMAETGETPTAEQKLEIILRDFAAETRVDIGLGGQPRPLRLYSEEEIENAINRGRVTLSSQDRRRLLPIANRIRAELIAQANAELDPDIRQELLDEAALYDTVNNRQQALGRLYLQEIREGQPFPSE